jgi:DNA-binding NarL/FixJ family response regulator
MPVMDGFTTIRLLRDRQEFEKLIIVGCSGSFFTYEQRELCRVGCDAFIPKPLQIETLLTLLQESLRLTWVYKPTVTEEPLVEETIPTVEIPALSTGPSTEQATTLFDLAMMGDIKGILQCVEELEQANEALVPFGKQVRELAKDFAEERICDLVQQFL